MIRNFNRSESTKRALADVRQLSWHSHRSASSFSTATGAAEAPPQTPQKKNSKQPQEETEYDPTSIQLPVESSLVPNKGSFFNVETVVRRNGHIYTMDLQLSGASVPLFVGEQHGQTYVFKSAPRDDEGPVIMGTVCKKPSSQSSSNKTKLTYAVTHHDTPKKPKKVAYVEYDQPSIFQVLKDSKTPRRCTVKVTGRKTIYTREPFGQDGGHRSLDFKGRGREASIKNMQLEDGHGNVVVQMVKWGNDVFHVDFSSPFDAFHAFGFALAQFDLNR